MQNSFWAYITSPILTIPLMVIVVVCLCIEGTFGLEIHHEIWFAGLMIVCLLVIGYTIYDDMRLPHSWASRFSHLGLGLVMLGAMVGNPWYENGQVVAFNQLPVRIAYTSEAQPIALPFEVELRAFHIDYYEDGMNPRQYMSTFVLKPLVGKDTAAVELTTMVNHPARYKGYHIYQDSYDKASGKYSVLRIVRDPLLPVVWIGMLLLAIGACMWIGNQWKISWLIPIAIGLAAVFGLITVARIRFGTLMPALRSWWFVPHLVIYMLAYSLMAIAVVLSMVARYRNSEWIKRLLCTASALLLLGMLCGAVWAKQAWGDYWMWDGKECWAAATWLLTIGGTHLHTWGEKNTYRWRIGLLIIAFISMQVTWYGVNYLPSAKRSLHSYVEGR